MKTHVTVLQVMSYVLGSLNLLWGLFFLLYFGMFTFLASSGGPPGGGGPPGAPMAVFGVIFGLMSLLVLVSTVLNFMAGVNFPRLQKRRLLIACAIVNLIPLISCMYVLGIPPGIYALVILFSDEGKRAFERVERGESAEKVLRGPARGGGWEGSTDADVEVRDGDWDEGKK